MPVLRYGYCIPIPLSSYICMTKQRPKRSMSTRKQQAEEAPYRKLAKLYFDMLDAKREMASEQQPEPLVAPDFAETFFEALAAEPEIARGFNEFAHSKGITLEVFMHELFAARLTEAGRPLPPKLREYLVENDPNMSPRERKHFGLDFN